MTDCVDFNIDWPWFYFLIGWKWLNSIKWFFFTMVGLNETRVSLLCCGCILRNLKLCHRPSPTLYRVSDLKVLFLKLWFLTILFIQENYDLGNNWSSATFLVLQSPTSTNKRLFINYIPPFITWFSIDWKFLIQ